MRSVARGGRRIERSGGRWGLLLVALVTCVALVLAAVSSYRAAGKTAATVTRDETLRMAHELRREVMRARGEPQAALDEIHEDLASRGLRFAGVMRGRELVASIGKPTGTIAQPERRPRHEVTMVALDHDGRVRAYAGLGPGRRHPDPAWRRRPPRPGGPAGVLVLELEPVLARNIMARAVLSLGVSLGAACILLFAAVVFWRLSLRADRYRDQLAHDGQLKALGQMSAVLGHEIRNPLASLKGHAQLLVEQLPADSPRRVRAETVVQEATRLEALTEQILDFARTGQVDLEPVDPAALARAAVEQAAVDPVTVRVEPVPESWPLDRRRMERVLCNLLTNARQASAEGQDIELSIGAGLADRLVVEVSDRGVGIPTDEEEQIFEPFHTTRVHGTGLGLALARRVVEEHGGRITAANRPGGGATFRVELPLPDATSLAKHRDTASPEAPHRAPSPASHEEG